MYKFQYNNNTYKVKQYIYNTIHLSLKYKINIFAKT